jgi:transposase-like protein
VVAYGIRCNGSRELIDFRVAKNEGKGTWASFLKNLQARGLTGSKLDLIVTDGGAELWAAVEEVYPLVRHSRHRRDWVHKLRNVANPADGGTRRNTRKRASPRPARSTPPSAG